MNPYNLAHDLAREVAKSSEYLAVLAAKEAVLKDAGATRMMNDYEGKQNSLYQLYQSGVSPSMEQLEEARALLEVMRQNNTLEGYFLADARLGRLISDIQKILLDAIGPARWENNPLS
ncbi:MAG: YlbF family regulator [Symbiobacteriaceae bacterium]|nr:YlbF family regulator [Symbiobacteriaceae bacterium]